MGPRPRPLAILALALLQASPGLAKRDDRDRKKRAQAGSRSALLKVSAAKAYTADTVTVQPPTSPDQAYTANTNMGNHQADNPYTQHVSDQHTHTKALNQSVPVEEPSWYHGVWGGVTHYAQKGLEGAHYYGTKAIEYVAREAAVGQGTIDRDVALGMASIMVQAKGGPKVETEEVLKWKYKCGAAQGEPGSAGRQATCPTEPLTLEVLKDLNWWETTHGSAAKGMCIYRLREAKAMFGDETEEHRNSHEYMAALPEVLTPNGGDTEWTQLTQYVACLQYDECKEKSKAALSAAEVLKFFTCLMEIECNKDTGPAPPGSLDGALPCSVTYTDLGVEWANLRAAIFQGIKARDEALGVASAMVLEAQGGPKVDRQEFTWGFQCKAAQGEAEGVDLSKATCPTGKLTLEVPKDPNWWTSPAHGSIAKCIDGLKEAKAMFDDETEVSEEYMAELPKVLDFPEGTPDWSKLTEYVDCLQNDMCQESKAGPSADEVWKFFSCLMEIECNKDIGANQPEGQVGPGPCSVDTENLELHEPSSYHHSPIS